MAGIGAAVEMEFRTESFTYGYSKIKNAGCMREKFHAACVFYRTSYKCPMLSIKNVYGLKSQRLKLF